MNILSLHPLRDEQLETIKTACPDTGQAVGRFGWFT